MKLWQLSCGSKFPEHSDPWHYESIGFVIRAESEEAARKVADVAHAGDMDGVWLDKEQTTCKELSVEGPQEILAHETVGE